MAETKAAAAKPARKAAKPATPETAMRCWSGFVTGDKVVVKGGATYDADGVPFTASHPLVRKFPKNFAPVESATAAPGELRDVVLPPPDEPTSSKRRDRTEAEAAKAKAD